jgi:hypothetical protein
MDHPMYIPVKIVLNGSVVTEQNKRGNIPTRVQFHQIWTILKIQTLEKHNWPKQSSWTSEMKQKSCKMLSNIFAKFGSNWSSGF